MSHLLKKTFIPIAVVALCAFGAWLSIDAGQLVFHSSGIIAEAHGGSSGCGCTPIPPTCNLSASPSSLNGAGDITLTWSSTNSVSGSIDQGVGSLPGASGFVPVYGISSTITFTATFLNSTGQSGQCQATVTVTPPPPPPAPTCTLHASPSTISSGGSSSLSWTTTNANSVSINQGIGSVSPVAGGSTSVSPSGTTTYTLTATGSGGTVTCGQTVIVTNPPPPQNGCIQILKETFNPSGNEITPVAQFTFMLDGATTTQNDANGNATFTNVTPGTHQVTEVPAGPTWTQLSVTPASGNVIVTSGSVCAAVVFKNQQVIPNQPPAPSCTLTAAPSSLTSAGTTTLSWTTTNATSASINNGIGSVSPVSGGSVSANVPGSTTFTLTVTGPGGTQTCEAPVTVTSVNPSPSCSLSLSASSINSGQSVVLSWVSANVTSGSIDNNIGTTSPVSAGSVTIFPPSSTTFNGIFTGPNGTVSCSIPLTVNGGGCAVGGCGGGGGGGLDQPDVALYQQPNPQPLAFVSLSQIPYTGFEAGPALTMIFWLAIGLLSALVAYAIVGKGFTRHVLAYVLGTAAGVPIPQYYSVGEHTSNDYGTAYPIDASVVSTPAAVISVAAPVAVVPAPIAVVAPVSRPKAVPATIDIIETRAHAAGVLMSPEAASLASGLSTNKEETLAIFGDILAEAVHSIPREDGWIMLTADKLRELSAKHPTAVIGSDPGANVIGSFSSTTEGAASAFADAVVSGDRESAFSIIRSLEHAGTKPTTFMTATATALDQLYRARRDGHPAPDLVLADKAAHISNEQLEHLVAIFTHALDHVYASPFTGVKLALAQAFELVG